MTETIYPYKPDTFERVDQIAVGMKIPARAQTQGTCKNCHDPEGLMFYYKVVRRGPVHYFEDEYGNVRMMSASLKSLPCPVCRPDAAAKIDSETEEEEEAIPWWQE